MSSKIKYKSKFLDEWRERVELKIGLKKSHMTLLWNCVIIAIKTFQFAAKGIGQVFSHKKSLKHKQNVPLDNTSKQSTIKFKEVGPTSESGSSGKELPEFRKQLQLDPMLHKESVLKTEVIWALEILVNSYSFRSSPGKGELFRLCFPAVRSPNSFKWTKLKQVI